MLHIDMFVLLCDILSDRSWMRQIGCWSRAAQTSPKTWRWSSGCCQPNGRLFCSAPHSPTRCRTWRSSPWTSPSFGRARPSERPADHAAWRYVTTPVVVRYSTCRRCSQDSYGGRVGPEVHPDSGEGEGRLPGPPDPDLHGWAWRLVHHYLHQHVQVRPPTWWRAGGGGYFGKIE